MHFISAAAVTESIARERIATEAGYSADTIRRLVHMARKLDNSRQTTFVFETANDVTRHPDYAKANLSDICDLETLRQSDNVKDGPVLVYGPEVTVGG